MAELFNDANPLRMESSGDIVSPAPISLRCPHCRHNGAFHTVGNTAVQFNKTLSNGNGISVIASIRVCPAVGCRGIVLVVQRKQSVILCVPPEVLDFDPSGLPMRCLETLTEAVACHAAGAYRAAAMMVRRLLEEICEENGAIGKTLHERLRKLQERVVLPVALFDAMGELKALGNDAAHIEAKEYAVISKDEATDCIELAKEILKGLYQLQGLLARLQARKITTP